MSRCSGPHAALDALADGCAAAAAAHGSDGAAASHGDVCARRSHEPVEDCSAAAFSSEAHQSLVPYEDSDPEEEHVNTTAGLADSALDSLRVSTSHAHMLHAFLVSSQFFQPSHFAKCRRSSNNTCHAPVWTRSLCDCSRCDRMYSCDMVQSIRHHARCYCNP